MWIKKLFGARSPKDDPDEEPARVAPTLPADLRKHTQQRLKPQDGFDPYNSGAFKRKDAWERITRK